jgi:hypothetical protein
MTQTMLLASQVAELERVVRDWITKQGMVASYRHPRGYRLLSEEEWRSRGERWGAHSRRTTKPKRSAK